MAGHPGEFVIGRQVGLAVAGTGGRSAERLQAVDIGQAAGIAAAGSAAAAEPAHTLDTSA